MCIRGNVSLSPRKTGRCTTQEIQFICLCKMSSFAPHIWSLSHNREELIVVFSHESKLCFLSRPYFNFSNAAHSWPDKWISKGWAKEKLPLQINFIHLTGSWYRSNSVDTDTSSQWAQCFMNIQKDSICHSPERWKHTANATLATIFNQRKNRDMFVNFELHVARPWRSRMSMGSSGGSQTQTLLWAILFMHHNPPCCLLCLWFQNWMRCLAISGYSKSDSHLFTPWT